MAFEAFRGVCIAKVKSRFQFVILIIKSDKPGVFRKPFIPLKGHPS
jgi:hypothetical protein